MAHKLPRLSKSLLDKPQLITAAKFQEIAEILESRELLKSYQKEEAFFDLDDTPQTDPLQTTVGESVGILRVEGPLTYKPTMWEALCGGVSYTGLLKQMQEFVDQGKKTVLMQVDSPGGQAYRMMFTARELRRMADENDIKLVAYVDGMMASAGMGLGAAAHEIVVNPEAEAGSIGVVISLSNNSKQLEKEGIERTFITAGASKVPFEDDGSFREGFLAELQDNVDDLYTKFTQHVADMRNIDVQAVRDTEAKMFKAEKALEIGLVDKIMEETEFYIYLAETSSAQSETPVTKQNTTKNNGVKKMTEEVVIQADTSVVEPSTDMAKQIAEMQAAMDAQAEQLAAYKNKEAEEATAALSKRLSSFKFADEQKEGLMSFFSTADESSASLMNSVLEAANESLSSQKQDADTKMAETVEAHETALAEATNKVIEVEAASATIREEFGTKPQESEEGTPVVQNLSTSELLKERVKKAKAAKAAAK